MFQLRNTTEKFTTRKILKSSHDRKNIYIYTYIFICAFIYIKI